MKKILLLILFTSLLLAAKDIRIVTPYLGSIENELSVEHMDEFRDSAFLDGLFFQWINPAQYQWNVFLYQSRDINFSDIFGSHIIFDYYLNRLPVAGKFVLGAGFDYIQIDTKGIPLMEDFKMTNRVYAPYMRFGRYINIGSFTLLPWIGYEHDMIRGDYRFKLPSMAQGMPAQSMEDDIDEDDQYALLGLNGSIRILHFIELSAKYYHKFSLDENDNLNTFSGMVNLYLNRSWGISYRYKYMEVSVSKNTYHMGGIAYMF